jgi:hypothetical protein
MLPPATRPQFHVSKVRPVTGWAIRPAVVGPWISSSRGSVTTEWMACGAVLSAANARQIG